MYFDPGSGSIIIQSLLAFLATISMFLVAFRTKSKMFFEKKNDGKKDEK